MFDSNGPSVRIRGNAFQVHEKYLGLARDAAGAGDRVAAENYYQHAEHYFRIYSADQEERAQRHGANGQSPDQNRRFSGGGNGNGSGQNHPQETGAANGRAESPAPEQTNGADGGHGANGEDFDVPPLVAESSIDLSRSDETVAVEAGTGNGGEEKRQHGRRPPRRRKPPQGD